MRSFSLPGLPSAETESPVEIADFWEIVAMRSSSQRASLADLRAAVRRGAETDPETDAEVDINEEARFDDAIEEVRYRVAACGSGGYPFDFSSVSERVIECRLDGSDGARLYVFLLLATRLNMNLRRTFHGIDAPFLFEEICEIALQELGGSRGRTHRFGTSAGGQNFRERLQSFFHALQEFPRRGDREIPAHGGDDGVDVAWWNNFSWVGDTPFASHAATPRGKLILLAQCKTGTSWDRADLQRLQPDSFFEKWMAPPPTGQKARAFMTTARVDIHSWEDAHRDGGLFFDRCRIVDYAARRLPGELVERIRCWTEAALGCDDFLGG